MSAATGEMRAARRAGSSAAAIVTPKPRIAPSTSPAGGITSSRIPSTPPPGVKSAVTRAARPIPAANPSTTPATARCPAEISTSTVTWRRVMPAARRSPMSRARSATVMASVLKIRKAPPKSASAATSAIVARKSAVEARRAAMRSPGVDSVYGSDVSRRSSDAMTAVMSPPGASPTSARLTASVPTRACAAPSGTMTLRPAGSGSPGTAARMPEMRNARGPDAADPFSVIVPPTASPSARASASETSATSPPARGSGDPAARGRSWRAASAAGSMPTRVTGTGRPVPEPGPATG